MKRRFSVHAAAAAALALCTLLTGCGYVSKLQVHDNSTPIVTGRALHRFNGPGGGGLEAEVSSVSASRSQAFTAADSATLNGQTILGPTTLNNRAQAQHLQLVYNHLHFQGRPVELEWFAGISVSRLQWDTSSSRPSDPLLSYRRSWTGPAGGVVGRVRLGPSLALEARYSGALDFRRGLNASRVGAELALAWSPAPLLQLRGGLAQSEASVEGAGLSTDLSLRVRGPFANVTLNF